MAHELEVNASTGAASMFYVGETPWHGLGTKLEQAPTSAEAIVAAGLDWAVESVPMMTMDGQDVPGQAIRRVPAVACPAEGWRMSPGAILGVVGNQYTPLQNTDAFKFFDPFLVAGEASLHTAGSLKQGKRVWILAKLNRDPCVIVPKTDDKIEKFVLLSNSHDGVTSVRVGFTPIRVVCANTLALAHSDKASKLIRVRHSANVKANLAAIGDIMNTANAQFEATAEQFRRLAARNIDYADLKEYVQLVFPAAKIETKGERKCQIMGHIESLFESGRGAGAPGVGGTLWGAYNAVNEYYGYVRGHNADNRIDSLWFGTGVADNKRALDEALAMC